MSRELTTWRVLILDEMVQHNETPLDIESTTISEEELDVKFYAGYGGTEGIPFTIWTKNRVYFPYAYDGAECCASVTRNPDGKPTEHIGGSYW